MPVGRKEKIKRSIPKCGSVLSQHVCVVDALCARGDFLPAQEDVVRIRVLAVDGVRHGVERADAGGELVDGVEVGAVLLLDGLAEEELVGGGEVLQVAVRRTRLPQQRNSLRKGEDLPVLVLDLGGRELLADDVDEVAVSGLESLEHLSQHVHDDVQDLVVVL